MKSSSDPLLRWFAWAHLPPHLQAASRPFGALAEQIVEACIPSSERTVALRKLLEAKDAAVRAVHVTIEQGQEIDHIQPKEG